MKRTVQVIDEELVDLDRHYRDLRHRHQQHHQHHPRDPMILIDEKVRPIHVIVILDESTIVNDENDMIIINIIIDDDHDHVQDDGQLKLHFFSSFFLFFSIRHSRLFQSIQSAFSLSLRTSSFDHNQVIRCMVYLQKKKRTMTLNGLVFS